MKFLLGLMLSFQFISAPLGAMEIGEKKSFKIKSHLLQKLAKSEAQDFEKLTRETLFQLSQSGLGSLGQDIGEHPGHEIRPKFKEQTPGHWEYHAQGHTLSFTLVDLEKGQLLINGEPLVFRGKTLLEIERETQKQMSLKKISLMEFMFQKTFGIENAEACEFVCLFVVVAVAVAVVGKTVYELMIKPEQMVKRMNDLKMQLDQEASSCEEAKSYQSKYEETFKLATSISDRSFLNSSSASQALRYSLKNQLESKRKDGDCFELMHEMGKKVDLDIPIPGQRDIEQREISGTGALANKKIDLVNAAFNLCASYNQLGSCMENFVAAHVNDGDISDFKDIAKKNHWQYRRKVEAGRQ